MHVFHCSFNNFTNVLVKWKIQFWYSCLFLGNPVYEEAAMRAMRALWHYKSNIGLVGNHVDVSNGKWTATDAGIGTL